MNKYRLTFTHTVNEFPKTKEITAVNDFHAQDQCLDILRDYEETRNIELINFGEIVELKLE